MRALIAMSGLADAAADIAGYKAQIEALKASKKPYQEAYDSAIAQQIEGNRQWPINHWGGQKQDQFQAAMDRLNGQASSAQNELGKIDARIADLNQKIADAQTADQKKTADDATAKAASPAYQADAARDEVLKLQRQAALFSMPGRYDFGAGSGRRNDFYRQNNLGESMSGLGLFALNRPTMGFDIWSAVAQGAEKGIKEYSQDPNKGPLPSLPRFSTGFSLPGVAVPDWLKSLGKPVSTIGKNVISSVQRAKNAPAPVAAAPTGPEVFAPARPGRGISPYLMLGAGSLVLFFVLRKRR